MHREIYRLVQVTNPEELDDTPLVALKGRDDDQGADMTVKRMTNSIGEEILVLEVIR